LGAVLEDHSYVGQGLVMFVADVTHEHGGILRATAPFIRELRGSGQQK
jgi:hypothetical protein